MQTFLPYPSFVQSAKCLDYRRLGKQRVEAKQILNALESQSGWSNHPAVRMWVGYVPALQTYHDVMITEWVSRGYNNSMELFGTWCTSLMYPLWIGNESFHASHRSNLLRKDPEYYGQFGWAESHDLPYVWPTKDLVKVSQ